MARPLLAPRGPYLQIFMGYLLSSGNNWFMGVSDEGAASAATACFISAGIYVLYLLFCGMKVMAWNKESESQMLLDPEAV